jgi:hypothetical protein
MKRHTCRRFISRAAFFLFLCTVGQMAFAQQFIDWNTTARSKRGNNGMRYSYSCPPISPLPDFAGYGTDIYTDDSYICRVGVHAGAITAAGGIVTIEIRPGQPSYTGSSRNGIRTYDYTTQWDGSFIVVPSGAPPTPTPGAPAQGKNPITSIAGLPNDRTANEPAVLAIDGDIRTYTWTTEAYNTVTPSFLAVGFSPALANRIRLWKSNAGGGGQAIKNLTVEYTTDTGPFASRRWSRVSGLISGYRGTEPFHASAVNLDGSVTGDVHDSVSGDGWGSLTFNAVTATGLRISFANPRFTGQGCTGGVPDLDCNHYRVGEIEVYYSP